MKNAIRYRITDIKNAVAVKRKASNGILLLKIRNIRNIDIVSIRNAVVFFIHYSVFLGFLFALYVVNMRKANNAALTAKLKKSFCMRSKADTGKSF